MFEQAFKNIDDVLWKEAGCTTEPEEIRDLFTGFQKYLYEQSPPSQVVH